MKIIKRLFSNSEKTKAIEELETPEVTTAEQGDEYVKLKLSLHPDRKNRVSELEVQQMEEELASFSPVKKNDINIVGIYAFDDGERVEVNFYIRNGLERPIKFEETPLSIVNQKGELLAYQKFDLRAAGEIEKLSARPFNIYFKRENVFVDHIPTDDWKLIFEMRKIEVNRGQ